MSIINLNEYNLLQSRRCSPSSRTRYSMYIAIRQLATLASGYDCWPSPRTSRPHKTSRHVYARRCHPREVAHLQQSTQKHLRACSPSPRTKLLQHPFRGLPAVAPRLCLLALSEDLKAAQNESTCLQAAMHPGDDTCGYASPKGVNKHNLG